MLDLLVVMRSLLLIVLVYETFEDIVAFAWTFKNDFHKVFGLIQLAICFDRTQ